MICGSQQVVRARPSHPCAAGCHLRPPARATAHAATLPGSPRHCLSGARCGLRAARRLLPRTRGAHVRDAARPALPLPPSLPAGLAASLPGPQPATLAAAVACRYGCVPFFIAESVVELPWLALNTLLFAVITYWGCGAGEGKPGSRPRQGWGMGAAPHVPVGGAPAMPRSLAYCHPPRLRPCTHTPLPLRLPSPSIGFIADAFKFWFFTLTLFLVFVMYTYFGEGA